MTEIALSNAIIKGFDEQVMVLSSSVKLGLWPAAAF